MPINIIKVKLSELRDTEHNPRQINKKDFEKLKKSLAEDPEFLEAREIVVDENNVILGGHQRVKALKTLGYDEIEVKQVVGWSDEKKRRFVIKDNIQNGDWDIDELANAWDDLPLDDWGIDFPTNTDDAEIDRNDIGADFDTLKIEVECSDEAEQEQLFAEFQSRGLKCRVI